MAVDVLEVETNNSEAQSTQFSLPADSSVRLLGTSESKDDKDYFAFTAAANMRVSVSVASTAGAKLEVNTRAGAQVFENEPKDGLNAGAWQATAGETYLLRLRAPNRTAAPYEVSLSTGAGSTGGGSNGGGTTGGGSTGGGANTVNGAEVEPNNKPDVANSAALNVSAPLTLTGTASKRDRDFFRVQPASAGTVTIDTGNSGIKVSIESPTGTKYFESEPQDGVTRGSFDVGSGSVFLVRARGTSSAVTQYSLSLTLSGGAPSGSTGEATPSATVRDAWLDSSDDGIVSPVDALMVINHINAHGQGHGTDDALLGLDTNDDRVVSALDVLLVVNRINRHGSSDVNDAFDDSDIRKRTRT